MSDAITLFHAPQSRSVTAHWALEEIGVPYEIQLTDIRTGANLTPAYLAINPMGKVPAVRVGDTVITESGAIALYLADRFAPGRLAPALDDPRRGTFLRWLFFAPVVDSALVDKMLGREAPPRGQAGWGDHESVLRALKEAIGDGPWILGDQFTIVDVVLGGQIVWGSMVKALPDEAPFKDYVARLMARPACQTAWGMS